MLFCIDKNYRLVFRLEYIVRDCDHLWNHHGYWWNSVGDMFLYGKVSISYNVVSEKILSGVVSYITLL